MAPEQLTSWSVCVDPAQVHLAGHVAGGRIAAGGVDVVDVTKLAAARSRWSGRLDARVFTERERTVLGHDGSTIGVAFGVKESVVKLLGGLPPGSGFHDIELEPAGQSWRVRLRGRLAGFDQGARTVVAGSVRPAGLPPLAWAVAIDAPVVPESEGARR